MTRVRVKLQKRQTEPLSRLNIVLLVIGTIFVIYCSILPEKNSRLESVSSSLLALGGGDEGPSRRRFLNYTSSLWEQLWLGNIKEWEKNRLVCRKLKSEAQFPFVRAFMKTTCTHHYKDTHWCSVDDGTGDRRRFWFNLDTGKVAREEPPEKPPKGFSSWSQMLKSQNKVKTFAPEELESGNGLPMVFSRFDFMDEVTGQTYSEYIEPLVSHLRHPLSACYQNASYTTRAYLIPPSKNSPIKSKKYYFDAGASRWSSGEGGPSLSFFTKMWKLHAGIEFDHIECWEGTTRPETFYSTVPESYKARTHYNQQYIASSPNKAEPFVPAVIRSMTKKEDYVLFKLDIDSGDVERGTVEYLLSHPEDLAYIDEFLWEHHVEGNYLMKHAWKNSTDDMSMYDSYTYFLRLRQLGIRAHSWV